MSSPSVPIPHDLPLPLPAPEPVLVFLLVGSFLIHILFVNLMVGGVIFTFIFQLLGLREPAYNKLAYEIAQTVTVNKSLAVVFGVAPLLLINVLYTTYFYTANALTGIAWILVIPMVTIAFLLLYLHKYAWTPLQNHQLLHLSILGLSMVIFLTIPLVFLTNANLMLFPDRWGQIKGFFTALMLPNVWPRYFHFLGACLVAISLFLVGWLKRPSFSFTERLPGLERAKVLKLLYTVALAVSGAQFVVGPLILLTLPSHGISWQLLIVIGSGAAFALPALHWMWREINEFEDQIGLRFSRILIALSCTVVLMVSGRHIYRDQALSGHQAAMAEKTAAFAERSLQARQAKIASASAETTEEAIDGKAAFTRNCAGCHHENTRLVGPPVILIRNDYGSNVDGVVAWAKAPGKNRDDYPAMPPMVLPDEELKAIAIFMLETSKGDAP